MITETMYDYMLEQPRVLNSILENRRTNTAVFVDEWRKHHPDRLYIIGSGTSYNAAAAAAPFMEALLGVETRALTPTSLPRIYGGSPYTLFVSQGGISPNTIAAMEQWKNTPSIALTGQNDCKINEITKHILIDCGPENVGPKTKGYTSTVLTLYLIALETAVVEGKVSPKIYKHYLQTLETAIKNIVQNIRASGVWLNSNINSLIRMEKCFVVTPNKGLAVAQEGALKILETLQIPVEAFEFGEYLRGPICALNKEMAGIYFIPGSDNEIAERIGRMAAFHRTLSPLVFSLGPDGKDKRDCQLTITGEWYTIPFEWIIPCQLAGAKLPVMRGINEDTSVMFRALDSVMNTEYKGAV